MQSLAFEDFFLLRLIMKFKTLALVALLMLLGSCVGLELRDKPYNASAQHLSTIPHISAVSGEFAERLKQRVNTDRVYIIVHPSYYLFFHKKPFTINRDETKNVVETFINPDFPDASPIVKLMKAYHHAESDFISSSQKSRRLVILLLPGGYQSARQYLYKGDSDEYARYINDFIGDSETVLYLESENASSGVIRKSDLDTLLALFRRLGTKTILLGGGYVGRCQEEFYKLMSRVWPEEYLAVVPEISAFSPDDISDSKANMFLNPDKSLNVLAVQYFLRSGTLASMRKNVNVRTLSTIPQDE